MSRKRTAIVASGVAAGAVAAGMVGRVLVRRRQAEHMDGSPLLDLPPEALDPVVAFDGTEIAVRAAGDPAAPVLVFAHGFSLDMSVWHEQWVDCRMTSAAC